MLNRIEISFKYIPKIFMSKECINFFGSLCLTFNEERSKGVKLFHADGRTDRLTYMTKLIVAFGNFANAPKTYMNEH